MLMGCVGLSGALDLRHFDLETSLLKISNFLKGCTNVTHVYLNGTKSKPSNTIIDFEAISTFENMTSLEELDISNWNMNSATNVSYMFENCNKLTDYSINIIFSDGKEIIFNNEPVNPL